MNPLPDRCLAAVALDADETGHAHLDRYDTLLDECLEDVFIAHDWNPMLGLVELAPIPGEGTDPDALFSLSIGGTQTVLNLWEIKDPDSLLSVMNSASDNPTYVDMSAHLMLQEVQCLQTILNYDPLYLSDQRQAPLFGDIYFKESLTLTRDPAKRTALIWAMSSAKAEMQQRYGWELAFAGNVITGQINRYVHIWSVPQQPGSAEFAAASAHYYGPGVSWRTAYDEALATLPRPRLGVSMVHKSFWKRRVDAFKNRKKFFPPKQG